MEVSYAQRRQWVLAQLSPDNRAYHVSGGLWLTGEVDAAALREAFAAIVARHAVLRTRFVANQAGEVEAFVDEVISLDWREETVAADALEAAARSLADEAFDLAAGAVVCARRCTGARAAVICWPCRCITSSPMDGRCRCCWKNWSRITAPA